MMRVFRNAAAPFALLILSACASGAGSGVAQLSALCAQQYQQASEQVRAGGAHAQEQRGAVYTHYVSPDCQREQATLDKASDPARR